MLCTGMTQEQLCQGHGQETTCSRFRFLSLSSGIKGVQRVLRPNGVKLTKKCAPVSAASARQAAPCEDFPPCSLVGEKERRGHRAHGSQRSKIHSRNCSSESTLFLSLLYIKRDTRKTSLASAAACPTERKPPLSPQPACHPPKQ